MEPESSLPHSQVPATCLYPEPARFSPSPTSHLRSILILSSNLRVGLPSDLFPSFPHQNPVYTSTLPPCVLHAPPISFLIWSPE